MADIMLKGGKMLNESCPNCNAPLFQQEGRTFCAKCGFEKGKQAKEMTETEAPQGGTQPRTKERTARDDPWGAVEDAEGTVLNKIRLFSERLDSGEEAVRVQSDVEVLHSLVDLLGAIQELKNSVVVPHRGENEE